MASDKEDLITDPEQKDDKGSIPSNTKFRFKKEKRKSRDDVDCERPRRKSPSKDRERFREHRHHRSKRHKATSSATDKDDPSLYDDTYLPNSSSSQYVDPEVAFRESLFDAMADDEGAQFWKGVYGQPIHQYPKVKETPKGELEEMTDEEYTAYVRAKMYEKTHQHLVEEKRRRDEAKKEKERLAKEGKKAEKEHRMFQSKVEESLKRGQERKKKKAWSARWESYTTKWDSLGKGTSGTVDIASIPWPTESGRRKDADQKEIERFFLYAPTGGNPTETQLSKILKSERVRWHPDKIQQKLGGQDVDENVLQAVTSVFQIIDRMWSEIRDGKR